VRVWARSMRDYSKAFSRIGDALAALPVDSAALDRKAIVLRPDNTSDFEALRSREGQAEAILAAYELMEANGQDVRPEPLEERRKRLARLLSRNTKAVSEVRPAGLVTPRQPTVPFQKSFRPSRRLR
jgi:bifunctional non-homologous end joining protein LigD